LEVLDAAAGQVWYQLAASAMVFAFGMTALCIVAFGRIDRTPRRRDARILLTATILMMGVSFVFMSGRSRADHTIYGRYTDAIVWPILGIGLAWLIGSRRTVSRRSFAWIVGGTAILSLELAFVVNQLHHSQLTQLQEGEMVAGLLPMISTQSTVRPVLITMISLAAGLALVACAQLDSSRSSRGYALTGAVLLTAAAGLTYDYRVGLDSFAPSRSIADVACQVLTPGETVGVGFVRSDAPGAIPTTVQMTYALAYQWYLPGHPFVTDLGIDDDVGPHVISPTYDPLLTEAGGQVLWEDVQVPLSLWREPGQVGLGGDVSAGCDQRGSAENGG
jgi:hypothetical protein